MKLLHFLFTNGAKFSLELPEGSTIHSRVGLLSKFIADNNNHVESHKTCYASGTRVKFPISRGFYVGYEREAGKIETLITPESKAIKYGGKCLLAETIATELQYRIDNLNAKVPFVGCQTTFTGQMMAAMDAESKAKEAAKERKLLKAGQVG